MPSTEKKPGAEQEWNDKLLFFLTTIPALLLAVIFLFLGAISLSEGLPEIRLVHISGILFLIGTALIYSIFRPYAGGFLLLICVLPFAGTFLFNPLVSVPAVLLLLLGWGFVTRGCLSRRPAPVEIRLQQFLGKQDREGKRRMIWAVGLMIASVTALFYWLSWNA